MADGPRVVNVPGAARPPLIDRVDEVVGGGVEAVMRAHHRRRLRRAGQADVLGPDEASTGWSRHGAPRRPGNALRVHIDGEDALAAVVEAVRGARRRVDVAGWHLQPDFLLERGPAGVTARELLAGAAERVEVRVLLWAGAPLPMYHPNRRQMREAREALVRGTRIRCALDPRERPMHCHHEKLVVVDHELAFVGGIDLTSFGGDRLDRVGHPPGGRLGWHDAAAELRGPAVADVARHLAARWREAAGEPTADPAVPGEAGTTEVQVVRTVPNGVYRFAPRGEFGILDAYLGALRSARSLIYLENQFLWSPEVTEALAERLRNAPGAGFRLVLVLPSKPKSGADDTRGQLGLLAEADAGRGRILACTIVSDGPPRNDVYVHAKVGIVDDRWLTVGSANLNEHSLFNDTEMNVVCREPDLARDTRLRLWSEHLGVPAAELEGDPTAVVDERWRPLADEQLGRLRRGEPLTHRLVGLPGVSRRSARLLGPLEGLMVDG